MNLLFVLSSNRIISNDEMSVREKLKGKWYKNPDTSIFVTFLSPFNIYNTNTMRQNAFFTPFSRQMFQKSIDED